jgi:hypothetical protein
MTKDIKKYTHKRREVLLGFRYPPRALLFYFIDEDNQWD